MRLIPIQDQNLKKDYKYYDYYNTNYKFENENNVKEVRIPTQATFAAIRMVHLYLWLGSQVALWAM